jgi:hypothetical protein
MFCCHENMPEAGYFIKKSSLSNSQFWRLKVQDQLAYLAFGEMLLWLLTTH